MIAAFGESDLTDRNLAIADTVNAVAAEHGASSAQVALAWVRAQRARGAIVPILGVRRREQIEDNLRALELELTDEELARLDEVSASSSASRMISAPAVSYTATRAH